MAYYNTDEIPRYEDFEYDGPIGNELVNQTISNGSSNNFNENKYKNFDYS